MAAEKRTKIVIGQALGQRGFQCRQGGVLAQRALWVARQIEEAGFAGAGLFQLDDQRAVQGRVEQAQVRTLQGAVAGGRGDGCLVFLCGPGKCFAAVVDVAAQCRQGGFGSQAGTVL